MMYNANNDILNAVFCVQTNKYKFPTSLSLFCCNRLFSFRTRAKANRNMIRPCPASPNITENKNGKEMMVNGAEDEKQNCETHG